MSFNLREKIGKYLAYDREKCALWGLVVDVVRIKNAKGEIKDALVIENMAQRTDDFTRTFSGRRVVHADDITEFDFVAGKDLQKAIEEDEDTFLRMLGAGKNGAMSSFDLINIAVGLNTEQRNKLKA